jgi:hypothetical protein
MPAATIPILGGFRDTDRHGCVLAGWSCDRTGSEHRWSFRRRRILDSEGSADRVQPVVEAGQPGTCRDAHASDSVVCDPGDDLTALNFNLDGDERGVRVFGHVRKRLCDGEGNRRLCCGREASLQHLQDDGHRRGGYEILERCREPALAQRCGVNPAGEIAQLGRALLQ